MLRSDQCLRMRNTHPFDNAAKGERFTGMKVQAMSLHSRDIERLTVIF